MEFFVVDALDLESRWEAVMAVWQGTAAKDVDLRLDRDGRTLGDAVNINTIVVNQEGVLSVGKATCLLVWVEAKTGERVRIKRSTNKMSEQRGWHTLK